MDGLETTYVALGAAALTVLGITLIFGELFDSGGDHAAEGAAADSDFDGPSMFSSRVISASLVGFSAFGYLTAAAGAHWLLTLIAAFAGMAAVGGGSFFGVLKPLYRQQFNQTVGRDSYLDAAATVTISIPEGGSGSVSLIDSNRTRVTQKAWTQDGRALKAGASVRVVEVTPNGVVVS